MKQPDRAERKTWFVTGCSSGLGRALAEEGLSRGNNVVVTARNPETIASFERRHPGRVLSLTLDVTDRSQIAEAVARARSTFGAVDLLFNNAAGVLNGAVEEVAEDEYRPLFETNFFGPLALMQAVLPAMRQRRGGHIVNISSMAAITGVIGFGHYGATKAALVLLSEALAEEVRALGIKVTIIELGGHATKGSENMALAARAIPDYAGTVAARQRWIRANAGREPGDARLAARAIADAVLSADPPLRIPIGADAVERSYRKLESRREEIDRWRELSESSRRAPDKNEEKFSDG